MNATQQSLPLRRPHLGRGRYAVAKATGNLKRGDYCACGRRIRSRAEKCTTCLEQQAALAAIQDTRTTAPPKHQPTSLYVQADPIAARYRFAAVLR